MHKSERVYCGNRRSATVGVETGTQLVLAKWRTINVSGIYLNTVVDHRVFNSFGQE